jgi:N6-adenosine-specific RNA methylase IME4
MNEKSKKHCAECDVEEGAGGGSLDAERHGHRKSEAMDLQRVWYADAATGAGDAVGIGGNEDKREERSNAGGASLKKYNLIYADPPWKFGDANSNGKRGAEHKYPVMTMGELFAIRSYIDSIAAPDCLLAMWWVSALPKEALDLAWVWGFEIWNMNGLVWNKQTKNGKEFFGLGRSTRPSIESCLFARRGRIQICDRGVRQSIMAPVREHSRKPDEAREKLVRLVGDVPRIELFARQRVDGWDAHGNWLPELAKTEEPVS